MAPPIALAAAGRTLRQLAEQAPGQAVRERIERLAALAEAAEPAAQTLSLGEVADALFPGDANAVERVRAFRRSLRNVALDGDVDLTCEVDGHKHALPHARRCWFTGTDDSARQLERLSEAATTRAEGAVEVQARARRAVRVCIDGTDDRHDAALSAKLRQVLGNDGELDFEVSDTRALAGESTDELRAERLGRADVVVCLLSHAYLATRDHRDLPEAIVMPVAMEHLGAGVDLRGFHNPLALDGASFAASRRKDLFAAEVRDQIVKRLARASEPRLNDVAVAIAEAGGWERLVPDDAGPIVEARALRTQLDRRPPSRGTLDATVDVQDHLRAWADSAAERPYLVIFGEYGMGKTTASQVFTRRLLERRRSGDGTARLPIYLDLRRLGDVKHSEPTLEQILDDLLRRVWQAGGTDPVPAATEVIDQVQRHRAVVIFDGLDEVLVHLTETRGQALLRELWKILPPPLLEDPGAGRVLFTCRTHFFRTLRDQHTYFRGEDREIVGADAYAALHLLPFTADQVRAYFERRELDADAGSVDRAVELIRSVHDLSELVQRPFNLRLVAEQLGALERRIASGERVDAAALYAELVATWLERDQGKHQLKPRHKVRLMGELAATLWRDGRRSLPVDRLEAWLEQRLDCDDELGRWFRLNRVELAVLAEDLRTATFIVRPGADEFEFAHTSLLEYFLALHLATALADGDVEAWALPMLSPETFDFLLEIVDAGDVEASLRGLRMLRSPYRAQASELAVQYCVRALERGAPGLALTGFDLAGAQLRGLAITGPDDGPLVRIAGCRLAGADLRDARLLRVRLERCDLSGARLRRAEIHDGALDHLTLDGADLAGMIVRRCRLANLDLRPARAHRTQWLGCTEDSVHRPPDGESHLVTGSAGDSAHGPSPAREGASLATFVDHTRGVHGAAWSPDSTRLATAGDDGSVRLWDSATGEQLRRIAGHAAGVRSVAWSPDAARLATAGDDGSVRLWDPASGDPLLHITGHTGPVLSVAWSPRNTGLASAGFDGSVRVWDPATGEQLHRLTGHTGWVVSVAWSPDGSRLATTANDGIRIRDTATGEQLHHITGHTYAVSSVAWSPDTTRLATAANDGVRVWDAATGEQLHHVTGHTYGVNSVAWSPDATRIASAGNDDSVRIWDVATGEQLDVSIAHAGGVSSVAWSQDGGGLATTDLEDGVRIHDAATGEPLLHLGIHARWVRSVAWSPDAGRLATSGNQGVRVHDATTGELLHHITTQRGWVNSVEWSPDASRLATAGDGDADAVRVHDAATGKQLLHVATHSDWVDSVVWSPDGRRLATAAGYSGVRIYDAATGEQLGHITTRAAGVNAVAWSPDANRLATTANDGVRIHDAATGEQLHHITTHTDRVHGVAWSPDTTRLATASSDSVRIHDAATGEQLHHITTHTDRVHGVAWSPDTTRLATAAGYDGVRIHDAATGGQLQHITTHTDAVNSVAWSPDSIRIATAGDSGTIRIHDAATGEPVLAIHIFAGGDQAVLADGGVAACTEGAWRWLGWLARSPVTGLPSRYPAESFGPLPVPEAARGVPAG